MTPEVLDLDEEDFPPKRRRKTSLSPRELEVLALAAQGLRAKQIARALWLSQHTVRNHLKSAYRVLGASDLAEALLRAVARGHVALPADQGRPASVPAQPVIQEHGG